MIDFLEEEHMRREVFTTRGGRHNAPRSISITDPSIVSDAGGTYQILKARKVPGAEPDSSN